MTRYRIVVQGLTDDEFDESPRGFVVYDESARV